MNDFLSCMTFCCQNQPFPAEGDVWDYRTQFCARICPDCLHNYEVLLFYEQEQVI